TSCVELNTITFMRLRRYHVLTIIVLLLCYSALAQSVHLKGRVTDESTGNPLEFANIALLSPSDSAVVPGGMTGLDGTFDIRAEPGSYIFRVGFIGYESYIRKVSIGNRANENFGNIKLVPSAGDLEEVTVQGVTS